MTIRAKLFGILLDDQKLSRCPINHIGNLLTVFELLWGLRKKKLRRVQEKR